MLTFLSFIIWKMRHTCFLFRETSKSSVFPIRDEYGNKNRIKCSITFSSASRYTFNTKWNAFIAQYNILPRSSVKQVEYCSSPVYWAQLLRYTTPSSQLICRQPLFSCPLVATTKVGSPNFSHHWSLPPGKTAPVFLSSDRNFDHTQPLFSLVAVLR